jgi:hypothetical protein
VEGFGVKWKRIAAVALVASLSACSIGKDLPLTTTAITTFHQQLNAGDSAGIYTASSADLKGVSTQDDFTKLLDAVHRKLGNFQSGSMTNWRDNFVTSGHFISIVYSSKYDHGAADEAFDFRIDGGKALLAGYHVSSNALIEN